MDESATILYNVNNFIHGEFDRNKKPRLVHIVSTTDDGKCLIMKEYIINETGRTSSFEDDDKKFFLLPMEWNGETEWIKERFSTVQELKNVLDAEANYGVWGFDQLKSFSTLLTDLVNVSSHFVKVLLAIDDPQVVFASNELPLTIGKVFRNLAAPLSRDVFETLPPEDIEKETFNMYQWVRNVAWPALMFWPYDSETNDGEEDSNDGEEDSNDGFEDESDDEIDDFDDEGDNDYLDIEGFDARLTKLTRDTDKYSRKW